MVAQSTKGLLALPPPRQLQVAPDLRRPLVVPPQNPLAPVECLRIPALGKLPGALVANLRATTGITTGTSTSSTTAGTDEEPEVGEAVVAPTADEEAAVAPADT